MKNYKISIAKSEILKQVGLVTAYTGVKSGGDADSYDRIATVESDDDLLSTLWNDKTGELIEKLREFIVESYEKDGELSLTFTLGDSFEENLLPAIETSLKGALAAGITGKWMEFVYPDRCDKWHQQSERSFSRAVAHLCFRKKPSRKE